ncbi:MULTISPECIES: DUF4837 family protein [unclassified Saccharicrinis]|uniref:DUF4837 family protein n=1 Tax=unclassified Saccharicrinis TaxID=2646859 RepID=UPI003D3295AB
MIILNVLSLRNFNVVFVALFFYISGCQTSGDSIKSRSVGAPGELLVVMDKGLQKTEVKRVIAAFANQEFPCVPQAEPTFKVSSITPNDFEGHFKAYRNIIIVQQKALDKPKILFRRSVWARHQQVVEIEIPNIASFSKVFKDHQSQIFDFLYYGDIKTMKLANFKGADTATRRYIHDKHGVKMVLPKGYRLVKDTADFSWFRFDRLETSMHIVLKSFELENISSISDKDLVHLRDSVGRVFIPGPSELTCMQTEKTIPVVSKRMVVNGLNVIEVRGLWKVEGFFMGGPFVDYFIIDDANGRLLMIDGFVHAPQKQNKAYYVRLIESILQSVKI